MAQRPAQGPMSEQRYFPEEINKTIFPDVFIVDYVRVYQKK